MGSSRACWLGWKFRLTRSCKPWSTSYNVVPVPRGLGWKWGKIYVTQRLQKLMLQEEEEAKRLKDEYVSVEHLILVLAQEGTTTAAGRILHQFPCYA